MLSPDDEQTIERILNEFARRGQAGAADTAALLSKLPAQPEAMEHFIGLARTRGLPWIEYLARTVDSIGQGAAAPAGAPPPPPPMPVSGEQLSAVLSSSEPYPRKIEALLAALRARHPELPAVIRKHLVGTLAPGTLGTPQTPGETDPFVLATLASALGQCGTALDGALLAPLLSHSDNRVVANALDSLRRLKAPPRAEVMVRLLESPDQRVRTNAIAFLGVLDPERALQLVRALVHSQEPGTRAGVAYVLGELVEQPGSTELLLEMNERELNMMVLKQIAISLKKHAGPEKTAALVGALHSTAEAATGAKKSVVGSTLHEIAVEAGLVASEVEQLAEQHRARRAAAPAPPAPAAPSRANSEAVTTARFSVMPPPSPPPATTTARFTVQPVPSEPAQPRAADDGDEELSFSGVWGAPPPPTPATTTGAMRVPSRTSRSGHVSLPAQQAAVAAAPPRRGAWIGVGAAVLLLGAGGAWLASTPPAADAPKPASVALKATRKSRVATVAPVPGAATAASAGTTVELSGRVVGVTSGRPVIESKGQYYLVVRSSSSRSEVKRGQTLTFAGRITGSSPDGLFYVEE